ncbi:MAG: YidC/Oxa1 family membrane protein insertase [Lentimonas sp.]|jgi:YidC/Oxa1 family membrane protein insertase
MDKKNTILGIAFIGAGLGFMFWQSKQLSEQRADELANMPTPIEQYEGPTSVADAAFESAERAPATSAQAGIGGEFARGPAIATFAVEPTIVSLSNEFIEVNFTTKGGAIRDVAFLQTKRGGRDDYVFNEGGYLPALGLSLAGADGAPEEFAQDYRIDSQTSDTVTFVFEGVDGLLIRRTYKLSQGDADHDPYIIKHSTSFNNGAVAAKRLSTAYFNLGTARPISANPLPSYLNVGYFDGEDADFTAVNKLTGSNGVLGIGASLPQTEIEKRARVEWSSVKNQFFAAVLSSEAVGEDLYIYPVEGESPTGEPSTGITGSVGYQIGSIQPGETRALDFDFFVGPKEFKRLQAMGNEQDRVMQFGFLSFISKLLLAFMYAIHSVVPSWGWSIVIMTICIKTLFWPLTAKASRSQKRMAKIQEPMAALKEKYKDNPQQLQQETLKLFKQHQVNPVAGCLPMLIQMPIFLGLFYMLRTASELRHEPFLWVADLAQPDTLMYIAGFPLNVLPLIMGVTMFFQMSLMPVSPTADPMQQKIFKFLPFVFLIFLYNFSSGLVLYWTVQNILTIVQQKIINSQPDEPLKPVAAAAVVSKGKGGSPRTKPRKK